MLRKTMCAAAVAGVAISLAGLGVAQAAPATPTATIRSTLYCYTGLKLNQSATLEAAPSAAVQTRVGSGAELVSGVVSGLIPGHTYLYSSDHSDFARQIPASIGTASSSGSIAFTHVMVTVDTENDGTLHAGTPDSFGIYDSATINNSTDPTPALTGKTSAITVNSTCGTLRAGTVQSAMLSTNRKYTLTQQTDGNLVLRQGTAAVWSSKTAGHAGAYTVLQPDGNLVVRSAGGGALWNSKTAGHSGAYLQLQTDRNLVVYGPKALWQSHTVA